MIGQNLLITDNLRIIYEALITDNYGFSPKIIRNWASPVYLTHKKSNQKKLDVTEP